MHGFIYKCDKDNNLLLLGKLPLDLSISLLTISSTTKYHYTTTILLHAIQRDVSERVYKL